MVCDHEKVCSRCGESKLLDEFYSRKDSRDGLTGQCKSCIREAQKIYSESDLGVEAHRRANRKYNNSEKGKASWSKYSKTEKHKETVHAYERTPKARARQKRRRGRDQLQCTARRAVSNAIRDGRLERGSCEICGATAEAHHEDYTRPFEIRWFCSEHHRQHHARS